MNGVATYEERLKGDSTWAVQEGGWHFEYASWVHEPMRRVARRLEAIGVDYAVVGAMARFLHGYRRFTEDVNLLVTPAGLATIHAKLIGDGYVLNRPGGKSSRDAENGVRVEFVVTGDRPGGTDHPVVFPDPTGVSVDLAGVRTAKLSALIELKLAAGTSPVRRKHAADVQEMIRRLHLPERIAGELDESVRPQYREMWALVQNIPREYEF
jgi:hypothetical protein